MGATETVKHQVRRCQFCGAPTVYVSGVCRWCQEMMKKSGK